MPDARRYQFRPATGLLIVLGLLFVGVAIYYFVTPAGSLASFVPGHQAGSSHHHIKHGIAALVVAVVVWVGAWFTTAPGSQASS